MTDKDREASAGNELNIPCPNCKKVVPCAVVPRVKRKDILGRISSFEVRLWERKQKEPLSALLEDIVGEIVRLRTEVSGLRGYGPDPPVIACPECNKIIPNIAGRENQVGILERINELQMRLKEKKSKIPVYAILEEAASEIGKLQESVNVLSKKK